MPEQPEQAADVTEPDQSPKHVEIHAPEQLEHTELYVTGSVSDVFDDTVPTQVLSHVSPQDAEHPSHVVLLLPVLEDAQLSLHIPSHPEHCVDEFAPLPQLDAHAFVHP